MISATDLITLFRQALDEGWGYIWGKSGQTWTQANQDAATRDMTVKYGSKWVGRRVADCSGLFVWAYKQLGASIYHGSNTIWRKYTSATGAVAGDMTLRPGTAVFLVKDGNRHHIGLYVGDGKCIEAKGTAYGVVESDLSHWDEWGELTEVDYTGVEADFVAAARLTLRKGSTGSAVKELQTLLIAAGYDVGSTGADGIYGSETLSAVRAYQSDHGLTPDGVCGPKTWAALEGASEPQEDDSEGDADDGSIPEGDQSLTIEDRLARLEMAVFGTGGGETDG